MLMDHDGELFIQEIAKRFNCRLILFGGSFGIDYVCERDGLGQSLAIIETLPGTLAEHPTITLRRDMLNAAFNLQSQIGNCKTYSELPLILFIEAKDGRYWLKLTQGVPYEETFNQSPPRGFYEVLIPTENAKSF